MNELFEELKRKATEVSFYSPASGYTVWKFNECKFAELIIQECVSAITKDSRLDVVRSAANGCVITIKEHFGVE